MTKEQMIYKNMKSNHRIYKVGNKFIIKRYSLLLAVKEAGYDEATSNIIIRRMIDKGYLRWANGSQGRANFQLVIEKWVN